MRTSTIGCSHSFRRELGPCLGHDVPVCCCSCKYAENSQLTGKVPDGRAFQYYFNCHIFCLRPMDQVEILAGFLKNVINV